MTYPVTVALSNAAGQVSVNPFSVTSVVVILLPSGQYGACTSPSPLSAKVVSVTDGPSTLIFPAWSPACTANVYSVPASRFITS